MSETGVIVNADDFGLSRDISDNIVKGYDHGVITSTTFMVTMPAAEYAARLAETRPGLGIGVHLNITTGRPASGADGLARLTAADGSFKSTLETARPLTFDFRLLGPLVREFCRQIRICRDFGITPTHCDTHHGVHRFPVVFEAFRRALMREGIKAARAQVGVVEGTPERGIKSAWKRFCRRRMRGLGIRTPDGQLRARPGASGADDPAGWFDGLLRRAPAGTFEIVLHPGMPADERPAARSLEFRRRDTALVERGPLLREHLPDSVRLMSYADLARPSG